MSNPYRLLQTGHSGLRAIGGLTGIGIIVRTSGHRRAADIVNGRL